MHELSVAQSILEIARNEMAKAGASQVRELELEVGVLSGIELESLQFALKALTASSDFNGMEIVIRRPSGLAQCNICKIDFEPDSLIAQCPSCHDYNCKIISGKELKVKSIVV